MTLAGLTVGFFGLGEAGSLISADLAAAGATVTGYDPAPRPAPEGVRQTDDPRGAVQGADLVMAATAAADSVPVPEGKSFSHWSTTGVPPAGTVAAESVGRLRVTVTVEVFGVVPSGAVTFTLTVFGPGDTFT